MLDYDIMRSQKNQILQFIKYIELDPFNFEWKETNSKFKSNYSVPCLCYKGTTYFFIFDLYQDKHYSIFSPGEQTTIINEYPGSWNGQMNNVRRWLLYLKRELNEPDMWEQLSQYKLEESISLDPEVVNKPFTVIEVKQITSGVDKMREYLKTEFNDINDAQSMIDNKFDYLIDAANRQGRRDWLHTSIGVLVTLGVSLGLSPEQGRQLMHFLKMALSGVVKLLT